MTPPRLNILDAGLIVNHYLTSKVHSQFKSVFGVRWAFWQLPKVIRIDMAADRNDPARFGLYRHHFLHE